MGNIVKRLKNNINLSKNSDGKHMSKKKILRVTETMAILLALCFVLSVTVASVNAATFEHGHKFTDHSDGYEHGNKYGQGYKDGYAKGHNDGKKQCIQSGSGNNLQKIPDPSNNDKSYSESFKQGYLTGYNEIRYSCLKNK
jgi:hypothetical protein